MLPPMPTWPGRNGPESGLAVVLRKEEAEWVLSDEGHTYMHLARDTDEPDRGNESCQRIIAGALSAFGIEDREGDLTLKVRESRWADSLYSFVQGLIHVATVSYVFTDADGERRRTP